MEQLKSTEEGYGPFRPPGLDRDCRTYYKIFGDVSQGIPLVVMHGGPFGGHDYMLAFARLWTLYEIPVIFYDHIGCGKSTPLRETAGNSAFWQAETFTSELDNLLNHLKLPETGYHLLGHSFGGGMAVAHAVRQPKGLRRLIIASGTPSQALREQSFDEVRSLLPDIHRQAILDAEKSGDYDAPAYSVAGDYCFRHFDCRMDSPPKEMLATYENIKRARQVAKTVTGTFSWKSTGSMAEWTCVAELPRITVPTLVYNAEFDTARDQQPFIDLIPKVRWVKFSDAGHSTHLESIELQDKVLRLVGDFLTPPPLN